MSVIASAKISTSVASLRDLTPADIPAISDYWLRSSDGYLADMGVDRARLGSQVDIRKKFSNAIRTGDSTQPTLAFAITLDDRFVGYTLLNRYTNEVNYSHWHIIAPDLRAKGLSTALYPHRIKAYFDLVPFSRLIHQTRTRNIGVNRMLDKFIRIAETKFIEKPDGVASPGDFHVRYVTRADVPKIFARAAELAMSI